MYSSRRRVSGGAETLLQALCHYPLRAKIILNLAVSSRTVNPHQIYWLRLRSHTAGQTQRRSDTSDVIYINT